jgi:RNA polymerase sigma factor (sigma-70 family)
LITNKWNKFVKKSVEGCFVKMAKSKKSVEEIAEIVAEIVIKALEKRGMFDKATSKGGRSEKTAYQKTEQLLFNYNGFKRIVKERMEEIENLRKYGVPSKSVDIVQYTPGSGTVQGTVLPEESVEAAVHTVQESIVDTVHAIDLVDKCMSALKGDPYYEILEMRYFEGRTQEDIAVHFGVSQVTISNNKSRLVRELSMRLFPNQAVTEMLE